MKILVVEDSPTMRQFICFALRRLEGAEIAEASDGVEGLKKFNLEQYSLVIVDINMPIMDGLKLVSLIRKGPFNAAVPVLINSSAMRLAWSTGMAKPSPIEPL